MPKFLKLSALLLGSTVFALALGELTMRLTGLPRLYINPEQLHFWKHDSLLGWAHRPGQEGVFEKAQFVTRVQINQRGLRDSTHEYERSGDTKRILVLGDSFAWGFGVDYGERFTELLESSMGVEVVNAGISGYSTDQQLLWLRNEGVKYDVDLILLVFCGNDDYDNHRLLNYDVYNKPRFERQGDTLALRGVPVPRPHLHRRFERFLRQHSVLFNSLAHELKGLHGIVISRSETALTLHTRVLRQPTPPWVSWLNEDPPFALTRDLIEEIKTIANARGAEFMIAATPRFWTDETPQSGIQAPGTYQDLMESLRSDRLRLLDVESLPEWDRRRMMIPYDGHWNVAGHEFVAQELQRFIEEHRLLHGAAAEAP